MSQGTIFAKTKRRIAAEEVTKIIGEPTTEDINQLEIECAEIAAKFETGIFEGGDELGHMAMVVSQETYRENSGIPTFLYTAPARLAAFDEDLAGAAGPVLQKRRIAEHKRKIYEYELFKGVQQGLRERILYAVDEQ